MLSEEVKISIDECVLCWLATANHHGEPNVSPKEIFTWVDETRLIIANIASPESEQNIRENSNVCVSFVHVFKQKGFKLKGIARVLEADDVGYQSLEEPLREIAGPDFPIKNIFEVAVYSDSSIKAPSYFLNKSITEERQVESALKSYGVKEDKKDNVKN